MRLAELQEAMQSAILRGDIAAFPPCRVTATFDREMRFSVYSDAYRLRLAAFLSNDYPVLREAMGDERFGALVEAFIAAVPSRVPTAQAYTRQLPDFLANAQPWCEDRSTIDLARLECALAVAFDAADAAALGIESLAEMPQDCWPRLVVTFHPSVATLVLQEGTAAAYEALSSEEASSAERHVSDMLTDEREQAVLIWRAEHGVAYRAMEAIEHQAFEVGSAGRTVAEICVSLAGSGEDDESVTQAAANMLSRWFADGIVATVAVAEPEPAGRPRGWREGQAHPASSRATSA
jgi:hypothetical protein